MALPPKYVGQNFTASSTAPETLHTVEMFLDYVCPFSSKMFNTVYGAVFPAVKEKNLKVEFIFRPQIQPWHPSSTLTHEAAIAVMKIEPSKFWPYSSELMKYQKSFFDVNVVHESRNETYKRLAKLGSSVGVDEGQLFKMLEVSDKPAADGSLNIGNTVTEDLKVLVKMARLVGVHVSPTVIVDGVVDNSVSSGWTKEQWMEYLEKKAA